MPFSCGGKALPGPESGLRVAVWICPSCAKGGGRWSDGERCHECVGNGLVEEKPDYSTWDDETDPFADGPAPEPEKARRPTAVMTSPCRDCAYRPGSPERQDGQDGPPLDRPFFCHPGAHPTADGGYSTPVYYNGMPVGLPVCAVWYALVTGDRDVLAELADFADTHPYRNELP